MRENPRVKHPSCEPDPPEQQGFSLIELMVASFVMLMFMAAAYSVSQSMQDIGIRGQRRAGNQQARESYRQAGELDPSYAAAAAGLALTHYQSVSSGWSDAPEESIELLIQAAERSVVLDHVDPLSQHAISGVRSGNRLGTEDGRVL